MTILQQICKATLTEHLPISDILNRTVIRRVFAYPNFTIGVIDHIFKNLFSFIGRLYCMKILYKTSLQTKLQAL